MHRFGWAAIARLAALSAAVLVASAGTAVAATDPAGPPVPCPPDHYQVVKGSGAFSHEQEHFGYGPDWRVESISDGQTGSLSLTRVVSTANTWSVTGGVKGSVSETEVSAVVGFSVTQTEGFNATKSLNTPAEPPGSKVWFVEAGTRDRVSTFKVKRISCRGSQVGPLMSGQAIERGTLIYRQGSYARQP